jgi:hypothetical protein
MKDNSFGNDYPILNEAKTYTIIPQKLFVNNQFLSEDTVKIDDYISFDNSFNIEKDEPSLQIDSNDFQILNTKAFDKKEEISKNFLLSDNNLFPYKKNRNNLSSYDLFEEKNNYLTKNFEDIKLSNCQSFNNSSTDYIKNNQNTNLNVRCDSLLIKFKSIVGKWFINSLNNKIKQILKRKIKFFSFNYKKFTIVVSYFKNKNWLDEKIKNLLILGDEPNQEKNIKALNSVYKRKIEGLNEIKYILEQTYRNIIEKFYLSDEFINFKNNKRVIELNKYFIKIMDISLLEKNGFIKFLELRKGNIRKK